MPERKIELVVRKYRLGEEPPHFVDWLDQPYEARWAAIEQMRAEYYGWDPEAPPRLERVARVVKRQ